MLQFIEISEKTSVKLTKILVQQEIIVIIAKFRVAYPCGCSLYLTVFASLNG